MDQVKPAWTTQSTLSASVCVDESGQVAAWTASKNNTVAPGLTATGTFGIAVFSDQPSDLHLVLAVTFKTPDGRRVEGAAVLRWTATGGWIEVATSRQMYH